MKKALLVYLLLSPLLSLSAQNDYYYPPNTGTWETKSPEVLDWCPEKLDSLRGFLAEKNTKSFIILHQGKIVWEQYFDEFTADSIWYYASAGKSVMGFLLGIAQEEGAIHLDSTTATYLGQGWTECPSEKEALITLRNQVSMTTGLEDALSPTVEIPDPSNCLTSECLQYLSDAGTRWAYHNTPYRLTQDVLEQATGTNKNIYTYNRLGSKIGMNSVWFNYVLFGKARDMARFGHLILSEGIWGTDTLLHDQSYFQEMLNSSQNINPSYGYLWWLNGKVSYKLPSLQLDFDGPLIPEAPSDMVAALGKNDQKIYVIPSQDLVVIRQGNAAGGVPLLASSSFDNQLWARISDLACTSTAVGEMTAEAFDLQVFPNPVQDKLTIVGADRYASKLRLFDFQGRKIREFKAGTSSIPVEALVPGVYILQLVNDQQTYTCKFVKN